MAGTTASRAFQTLLRAKFVLSEVIEVPPLLYTIDDLSIWRRKTAEAPKQNDDGAVWRKKEVVPDPEMY